MSTDYAHYAHSGKEKYVWPAAFLILIGWGAVLLQGGYAHYEGQFFLANYVDDRSALSTIFSAHHNEWDCYQGRELSFLFGWLDAQAVTAGAMLGAPHLYSLTHFAGLLVIAVLLWRFLPRLFAGVDRTLSGLIVCLLLSSPLASLSGFYYRPAKILAAVFLVIALEHVHSLMRPRASDSNSTWHLLLLAAAATLMGLSDRLGIYLILLLGVMVLIAGPFARALRVQLALGGALVANIMWSVSVGPRLSFMADGFMPDTSDQRVRLRFTFLETDNYGPALSLWLDHVSQYFGNAGPFAAMCIVVGMAAFIWGRSDGNSTHLRRRFVMLLAGVFGSIALYIAMYARLDSLVWPASRRVYYWLPQLVCIAIATAAALGRIRADHPTLARGVSPLLVVIVLANLVALPGHRTAVRSQEHAPWIAESGQLRSCMSAGNTTIASYGLSAPAAQICQGVRLAATGTSGPGPHVPVAKANPALYCRNSGRVSPRAGSKS